MHAAPDVDPAATERWFWALLADDPDGAGRAFWHACRLVRDVTRAPLAAIADAMGAPEPTPDRDRFEGWFWYGLHLVRLGLYARPGTDADADDADVPPEALPLRAFWHRDAPAAPLARAA